MSLLPLPLVSPRAAPRPTPLSPNDSDVAGRCHSGGGRPVAVPAMRRRVCIGGDLPLRAGVQATDDQGNPVTVLQANGLALDQRAVQQICLRRARLETEPQPQTCAVGPWGPSRCWRLANAALLSCFGLTTRPSNGAFCYYTVDKIGFMAE